MSSVYHYTEQNDDTGRAELLIDNTGFHTLIMVCTYDDEDDDEPTHQERISKLTPHMAEKLRDYLNFAYPKN